MAALGERRRASAAALLAVATLLVCLAGPAMAAGNKTGQVTVFWGRNKDEGTLREACDTGLYTMVIMSFLDVYGPNGKYHLDISGHPIAGIGDDIKHCQFVGVPVSLSIGGFGSGYSLPSKQAALDLFDYLWNAFFGGSKPGVHRAPLRSATRGWTASTCSWSTARTPPTGTMCWRWSSPSTTSAAGPGSRCT